MHSKGLTVPVFDDIWAWAILTACQILILAWAEMEVRVELRGGDTFYVMFGGTPKHSIPIEHEDGSLLSKAHHVVGGVMGLACIPSLLASSALVFPGDTFYEISLLGRIGWMVFWVELYAADIWLCLMWARHRHRHRH
jgi:hypothetical protein